MAVKTATAFLWGTSEEVAARVRSDVPSFRLVNSTGDLPATSREFVVTGTTGVSPVAVAQERDPPVKTLLRHGRTVGLVWEDAHAVY